MGSPTTENFPKLRRKTSEQLLRDQRLTPAEREDIIKHHLPDPREFEKARYRRAHNNNNDSDSDDNEDSDRVRNPSLSHNPNVVVVTQSPSSYSRPSTRSRSSSKPTKEHYHHSHHHSHGHHHSQHQQPPPPPQQSVRQVSFSAWLSTIIKSKIHYLAYFAICVAVGFWIRGRQAYRAIIERILAVLYHHHRTPELIQRDTKGLSQLPAHLSCVLKRKREASDDEVVEMLGDDVAELVAWSSCAGIPMLSIYERTGALKPHIPKLHRMIVEKLASYYGFLAQQPTVYLYAPHQPIYNPDLIAPDMKTNHSSITVLLLSASDGRETLVDLTKTLAEMAQHGKISPHDISVKLVDAELCEIISPVPAVNGDSDDNSENPVVSPVGGREGLVPPTTTPSVQQPVYDLAAHEQDPSAPFIKPEPDLLIVFGPYLKLDGYPPWAIRLTEMYCTGDKGDLITGGGGETVEYQKFLEGLWSYAKAEMRFGR